MSSRNHYKPQFTATSFFTSFKNNEAKPNFGLPIGLPTGFLQSPSWQVVTTKEPLVINKKTKKRKELVQQAMYILPKSPSNASIYLQLPKFRSLSVFLRCGHVSQLVESWLCNPMDQLKKNVKQYYQPQKPSLCIMPSSSSDERSLVSFRSSLLSIHFQLDQQIQTMEIKYDDVPCMFTVVCLTYNCGSISLTINQIESLDFLLSATTMEPFLVKCDLLPNHPVDVHHLQEPGSFPLICDYAEDEFSLNEDLLISDDKQYLSESLQETEAILLYDDHIDTGKPYLIEEKTFLSNESEYIHFKETILYDQEDEEDDESCIYSSSEEYSILDDLDTDQEEQEKDAAQIALLNLVRDTLEYIQSDNGALSDELNRLEYKLYNYCRAADTLLVYD